MAAGAEEIKAAAWEKSYIDFSAITNPVNDPTRADFSGQQFDAYKQSGNAQSGTGTQRVFMGMACYTIAVPAEASTSYVDNVKFLCAADKFCVGGLNVAAVLSNSGTPPAWWTLCREGGTDAALDASGNFRASEILSETAETVSQSTNRSGEFTLNLSGVTAHYNYLHLVVSLFDYTTQRREYWVEGSGYLDALSIAVTYSGDFEVAESVDYGLRAVLWTILDSTVYRHMALRAAQSSLNITDPLLRRMYVADMLSDAYSLDNYSGGTLVNTTLRAFVTGEGLAVGDTMCFENVRKPLAGHSLWLKSTGTVLGKSKVRVSVVSVDAFPDFTKSEFTADLWQGTSADTIGLVERSGIANGDVIEIPIFANQAHENILILVSLSEIDPADAFLPRIGFPDGTGISVINAHFSKIYYPGA